MRKEPRGLTGVFIVTKTYHVTCYGDTEEDCYIMAENLEPSKINEDEMVKRSCVERLSQFFRVSPNALSHFKFDGTDNIKALTKALNSTSDEGTEAYYKVAIRVGKQDAGIEESEEVAEAATPIHDLPLVDWQRKQFDKLNDVYVAYINDYAKSKGDKDAGKKTIWQLHDKYGKEITDKLGISSSSKHADIATALIKAGIIKESVNEPIDEGSTISVPKLSDIDHTRIIKWMSNQFDSNTWDMKKSGKGFEISIDKLSKAEQEDLMAYLKSQDYIKESKVNESAMSDIDLLAQEAKDFKSFVKEFKKEYKNKFYSFKIQKTLSKSNSFNIFNHKRIKRKN
jgi:hypothetical protein